MNETTNYFRGFIAVEIKPNSKLLKFVKDMKNSGANIKLVEPENIHITLKFLGDTNIDFIKPLEEIIKKGVEKINPFNINLKGVGVFPNKNYIKVIWVGIEDENDILLKISSFINEECGKLGFKKEKRKFSAHLTIGRVRSAKNKDTIISILDKYKDTFFGEIQVNSIILKKSELTDKGPIYSNIKEIRIND